MACLREPIRSASATAGAAMADPFLKWAGGKRAIVGEIVRRATVPRRIGHYFEPFLGGGSVFFALAPRIDVAILADSNPALCVAYSIVRDDPEALIARLRGHERNHADPDYYYRVREALPVDRLAAAARFIYLNRTCYNGLWRVNRDGKFNVPRGNYAKPRIVDAAGLRAASAALQCAEIVCGDFAAAAPTDDDPLVAPGRDFGYAPGDGDLVYADPPYDGTFTSYSAGGFGDADQERLRNSAVAWAEAGARVIVSNSDTPLTRRLYEGPRFRSVFAVDRLQAPRRIARTAEARKPATEILAVAGPDISEFPE